MAQYDGSIRIVTKITTKDAEESLASLEWQIKKSAKYMDELRSKMDALKDQKTPTEDWKDLEKELSKAKGDLEKLIAEQTKFEEIGITSGDAWNALNTKIADADIRIDSIKEKMQSLADSGKDFTLGQDTAEYKAYEEQLRYEEEAIAKAGEHYNQLQQNYSEEAAEEQRLAQIRESAVVSNQRIVESLERIKQLEQEIADLKKAGVTEGYQDYDSRVQELTKLKQEVKEYSDGISKAKENYKKLGNTAKKSLEKVGQSSKKAGGLLSTLGNRFKGLALSLLIFNQISKAFNAMISAIKEGFSNLYKDKSMESFRNKVDSLKASMTTLKNAFAAAFRPLVEMAIPYIQKAVEYLTIFLDKIGQFLAAVAGQKTYTKAIKQTTSAIKEQNKAQNRQLSSLDKLNNLSSGGGDNGGDGGAGNIFEEVPIDSGILEFLQKLKDFLKPIIDYAQKLKDIFVQGFWDGLGDWEYRWESIKNSLASIKDSLIDIWTDPAVLSAADGWAQSVAYMLGSLVGSTASIGLTIATNLIGGIAKYLDENKDRIKDHLISMFDIWAEINQMFADLFNSIAYVFEAFASEDGQQLTANIIGIFVDAFMGIIELASKLFRDIAQIIIKPFVDNKEAFRTALEGFLGVLADVTGTIKQGIDDTFDKLNEVYDAHFKPFFDSIANGLSDTVGKFLEMWNTYIQPILDRWAKKFDVLWKDHLQPVINNFIELLGSLADLLTWLWEKYLKPQLDWFITVLGPTVGDICDFIMSAVDVAVTFIADMINGIVNIVKGVIDILVGLLHGDWQKVWDGFSSVIEGTNNVMKGIINSLIGTIEWLVNGVIAGVNTIIRAINSINFTVPNWIPGVGGKSVGFNLGQIPNVSIPRLATGTVVPPNREFMAVLGDNKQEPEVVSPLSTMKQAMKEVLLEMGMSGMGNGKIELHVTANVEGKTLFEITQDYALDYFQRTGMSPYPI